MSEDMTGTNDPEHIEYWATEEELIEHDASVGLPGFKRVEANPECGICGLGWEPTPFCPIHGKRSNTTE